MITGHRIFAILCLFLAVSIAAPAQQPDRDRGIELYREGKFAEAIEILEKSVIVNGKTDRVALIFLGGAYKNAGNEKEAVKRFRQLKNSSQNVANADTEVEIISRPRPRYSREAKDNMTQGVVNLAVEYRADGMIGFVLPYRTLPFGLTESSIQAARQIRFKPAMKDGKPVTSINLLEYTFWIQ